MQAQYLDMKQQPTGLKRPAETKHVGAAAVLSPLLPPANRGHVTGGIVILGAVISRACNDRTREQQS